jgi:hypothetical protein
VDLHVSVVPARTAADAAFVAEVVDLVNRVYTDAEKGLWREDTDRTDADEVTEYIRTGQLAIAQRNVARGSAACSSGSPRTAVRLQIFHKSR